MTNQEAFEAARAGDWIAESFTRSGDVFIISGKSAGYSSFDDCLSNGDSVFYSAFDEADNREAGLAVWDSSAKTLTPVEIHASLVGGAFIKGDPDAVQFTSGGTITGTLNATAFNTIWGHVFEKGNPHDTQADEIDQSNDKLGDTVQDALNKIATYVIQLDPDGNSDIDWGDLDGLKDLLDSKADQTDLEQEILDRIAGDAALQAQIDAIDPDGDSDVDWSDIENKPATYPPSVHGHQIDDVDGLQDALDAAGGTPAWGDVTGKPTEFPPEAHTHEQSEVDGLELRLDAIEGSITDGGGFVDAPDDGKLYGRQSEAWAEVAIPDAGASSWNDLTDKPTEYPPSAHGHAWDEITGTPSEFPPEAHNHDGVYQPVGDYVTEAPDDGKQYVRESEAWAEVSIPEAGAAVQIGEAFDGTPSEGDQWLETPAGGEAVMWVYDGEKWLQMPGGGGSSTVTTSGVLLDQPTARMPSGATTQADANAYFATALQEVVDEDGNPLVDLSDYYTSTEADEKFQPKGDFIEDAPSDGELYVRKDGAWELYTPSSGGAGGGNLIDPIIQPVVAGDFSISSGVGYWKTSTFRPNDSTGTTINFPIPNGYKFILLNMQAYKLAIWAKEINIDDVMIYGSFDESVLINGGKLLYEGDGQLGKPNFLVSDKLTIHTRSTMDNGYVKVFGMFIPADSTFESAEIRDAYIAANAEAWAALPPPEPEPEEVGTQEISDE